MTALIATFRPEAWVRDEAVECDAEGDTEWNPRPYLEAERPDLLPEILAVCASDGEWQDDSDLLADDPAMPEWARQWTKVCPFTITVRTKQRKEPRT